MNSLFQQHLLLLMRRSLLAQIWLNDSSMLILRDPMHGVSSTKGEHVAERSPNNDNRGHRGKQVLPNS